MSEMQKFHICNEIGGPFLSIFKILYRDGILEDYAVKRVFVRIYRELSSNAESGELNISDIGKRADNGDITSIQTFHKVGEILAESLHNILVQRKIECLLFSAKFPTRSITWNPH